MDGLDIAICRVEAGHPDQFALVKGATVQFPSELQDRLRQAHKKDIGALAILDDDLGRFFASALASVIKEQDEQLDLVGSHGQTVFHDQARTTLQIGEPSHMALQMRCPVVSDFRRADMAAGGCGAPLVPILDKWVLAAPEEAVLALNLGGIANFTALPPTKHQISKVVAFDTGPANMILDLFARDFSKGKQRADIDGKFSLNGTVRQEWLEEFLRHPYFAEAPPKACGDVEFGEAFARHCLDQFKPATDQDWYDLFATTTELSAKTIADAYRRFVAPELPVARVVASGGGVHNTAFMARLREQFHPVPVVTTDALGLDPHLKEAIAFAVMASARLDGIPANLPDVTGAAQPVLLGKLTEIFP